MGEDRKRQLPALTGMRFFLALWVVCYHQSRQFTELFGGSATLQLDLESILDTGYSAVGVFFVLSGFVLAYNYDLETLRAPRNLTRFGIARFSRIYPAYMAGMVLLIPLLIYRVTTGIEVNGALDARDFLLNTTLLQAWVPSAVLTWNYPGWSLSNEAFFYAALPFTGYWIWRLGGRPSGASGEGIRKLLLAAGALWLLSMAVPLWAVFKPVANFGDVPATEMDLPGAGWGAQFVRYNPLLRFPEFCMGIVMARIYRCMVPGTGQLRNRGAWLYLPGIALTVCILANADRIPYPLVHNGLLLPAYSAVVLGLALEGGFLARVLSAPVVVFLGNASYSMYILHAPIAAWMGIGFARVLNIPADGWVWCFSYLIGVIALSCAFFRVAEDPAHRWLKANLNAYAAGPRTAPLVGEPRVS
jgi:peptidoglycan/LPS O-acetylase OafA/YrhL